MNQTVRTIQVGLVDGKPAVTFVYDNDTSHTVIFSLTIAKSLGWNLASLCERLEKHAQDQCPGDGTSVGDGCSVGIQPPKEE